MLKILATFFVLSTSAQAYVHDACKNSFRNDQDLIAFTTVAKAMKYTVDELCSLERLGHVHMTDTVLNRIETNYEDVEHTWVSLHYYEYSCQYFVSKKDLSITMSNCYSGF